MKYVGIVTTFTLTAFLSALWSGYVLSVLWGWFIVPGLHAPVLTVGYAIGVSTVVNYMTAKDRESKSGRGWQEIISDLAASAALKPAVALGIGWIVTLFL